MLNNREWAILFWLALFLAWALSHRDARAHLPGLLRSFAHVKILVLLALMAAWVALEVWLASMAGIWRTSLIKETTIWYVTSGLVLFFNFGDASKDPDFLRKKLVAALIPVALLGVVLDIFVLPLIAEVVLQLVLVVLVLMAAAVKVDAQYRSAARFAEVTLGLVGFALIARAVLKLLTGWDDLDKTELLLEAVLPGWLTIGLLPFIYGVAVYAAYEMAFIRINWKTSSGRLVRLQRGLTLLTRLHLSAHEIASFTGAWPQRLAEATSYGDARQVVSDFRESRRERARREKEARERLVRFAGVDGVDADGRRLDRREFKETTAALRWLGTCMMGWYRRENRENHYKADLLERLSDNFTRQGLPKPSGITMRVSDDGQAWYAWRRTVSGWCFAIGAAAGPPDQWEYDGPEPPAGFPGEDPAWGSHAFSFEANRNW